MAKYRAKKRYREPHPKIFIWSHTEKAEIEYFQDFRDELRTPLLVPKKKKGCTTPQKLLEKVVEWKKEEITDEDGDQVWCIFDVDDFYKNNPKELIKAIKIAKDNNIKIAYTNECFELWILLHFEQPVVAISRGSSIEKKIQTAFKKYGLGVFKKNQRVFKTLLPYQSQAIKNAKKILSDDYKKIEWVKVLSGKGNPSTSIHFLIEEINQLIKR